MALSRSEQMSRIRGANTKPEVAFRSALAVLGLIHEPAAKAPIGKPDIVLPNLRIAVFIDGCFWHGCPQHYVRPRSRTEFWSAKLIKNLERDANVSAALADMGWRVIRLWEHEVVEDIERAVEQIVSMVAGRATPSWSNQRRVRRVVEIADRVERREVTMLGAPTVVIDSTEGPRVTAKARVRR